jgi:DNA-binding transcriptional ArsR family regulator
MDENVIQLRMGMSDLERFRFAYSPLTETAESLRVLVADRVSPPHRGWYESVRGRLRGIDLDLLATIVPEGRFRADFLFAGACDPATTMDSQLQTLTELPVERVHQDLALVWGEDRPLPAALAEVVAAGSSGVRRLADALWQYWLVAVQPHWRAIRSVLDDDVAYRAGRLTAGGIEALLGDLHPDVGASGQTLLIDNPRHTCEQDLGGRGLLLIPAVFVWPRVIVGADPGQPPFLVYGARGVDTPWGDASGSTTEDEALAALLGRSRAAILVSLSLPQSTTELSLELGQSAPSVSQHLSVLRRSGLVTSWRSGRRVLYHRTPLATSMVAASAGDLTQRPA